VFADPSRLLSGVRPPMALALRGRAIRIFGGQALVLTLSLLLGGISLIADEFRNPLASQSVGLFAAAFILATAMTLLVELTQLFRTTPRHTAGNPALNQPSNVVARSATQKSAVSRNARPYLPYHRGYVDRVRVRA
jgi:hypothetical protein